MQLSSELPRDTSAILDDLRRIVRVLRESSREAERVLGVSGAQLFVLRSLASAPALSLNALAARTRTHQSSVSVVVKRLADRGLVSRTVSARDARQLQLSLTARGAKLLQRAPLAAQDELIRGVEQLPETQRRKLAGALRALVQTMHLDGEPPEMFFEENSADSGTVWSKRRERS
jgi:DNA-binding MarR family transcriptional regulator